MSPSSSSDTLPKKAARAAEAGDARRRVAGAAARSLDRRPHAAVEQGGSLGVDEVHRALDDAVLDEERIVAFGDDVDDRIADAQHVVLAHSGLRRLSVPERRRLSASAPRAGLTICRFNASPHAWILAVAPWLAYVDGRDPESAMILEAARAAMRNLLARELRSVFLKTFGLTLLALAALWFGLKELFDWLALPWLDAMLPGLSVLGRLAGRRRRDPRRHRAGAGAGAAGGAGDGDRRRPLSRRCRRSRRAHRLSRRSARPGAAARPGARAIDQILRRGDRRQPRRAAAAAAPRRQHRRLLRRQRLSARPRVLRVRGDAPSLARRGKGAAAAIFRNDLPGRTADRRLHLGADPQPRWRRCSPPR